ncbi:thymidylate synthase [Streptomyces europaeiscabiei]|uniref:thymidylate synthase n=1 Tax=Streptomyces europaeiscabiei TaxID=146819 RepID=UPI00299FB500|nr:thymidylate synthase [Streptomyces europaeiscabiei]MDX3615750.1 thymidylate synthase [Streptomyces europaeiscabiei]WUD33518.1 thymidylate synthase [Streptomyces europaeiscabiei]
MSNYHSFADSYTAGLRDILAEGSEVASVRDPLSKASGFGQNDRPYRELLAYQSRIADPTSCLAVTPHLPVNLSYCFGLLAWSLDGRNDVDTPAYYRRGAHEYSDDQHTLSGAFGHRLLTSRGNQLAEVVGRIERDPAHRRAFALVLQPEDNFRQSREYPCAVGVHLFLRDGALTWITVMRAQQALTVLPYDAFLFMGMQQYAASLLNVPSGPYIHQSGTFHFYDNELDLARKVVEEPVEAVSLPAFPGTADGGREVARELVDLERRLRLAAQSGDVAAVDEIAVHKANTEFADVARACLATHAYRKLGDATSLVTSPASSGGVANLIAAI